MTTPIKPKRYYKPTKGCAWCRYADITSPYHIWCKNYPDFEGVDFMGWCDEFEAVEASPKGATKCSAT